MIRSGIWPYYVSKKIKKKHHEKKQKKSKITTGKIELPGDNK